MLPGQQPSQVVVVVVVHECGKIMEFCFNSARMYVMVICRNIFRLVFILFMYLYIYLFIVLHINDYLSASGQYVCVFIVLFIYMAIIRRRNFALPFC